VNADVPPLVDVVVLTLPPQHALETIRQIKDKLTPQHVIVSVIVPMTRQGKLFTYSPVTAGGTRVFSFMCSQMERFIGRSTFCI
jgi:predicted dinucleotide-binding enzyme